LRTVSFSASQIHGILWNRKVHCPVHNSRPLVPGPEPDQSRSRASPLRSLFRRVFKIAKSDYQLRHACTSVCTHGTTLLALGGFSWNL